LPVGNAYTFPMHPGSFWWHARCATSAAALVVVCMFHVPSRRPVEPATFASEDATVCLTSEALAGRALQFLRPFSERLRALVSQDVRALMSGGPAAGGSGNVSSPQIAPAWEGIPRAPDHRARHGIALEAPLSNAIQSGSSGPIGPSQPPSDLPRVHAASLESIEYLKLLVDYGVLPPPWIKDWTRQLGATPSIAATADFLSQHPSSLIVLRWTPNKIPLEARLLNDYFGDLFPLSIAAQMRYLRRQFRDIRALWLINWPSSPSPELWRANDDLLTLGSTFRRIQELDPSLAILAGAQDKDQSAPPKDDTTQDFEKVQEALWEATDMAVWEEDYSSALRLLEEADGFSERRVASVFDAAEKHRLSALSLRARGMSQEVSANPERYAAQKQAATWRAASPEGIGLLKRMIGTGQTVDVSGEAVDAFNVESADGKIEVSGMVVHPKNHDRAPWLYGIQVDVLQNIETSHRDGTVAVTGLPIALFNTTTGKRQVRCLRHVDSETDDLVLSTAFFADLSPGTYRVELFAPPNAISPPETSPGGTSPSPALSLWWGLWASVRSLGQSEWFQGNTEPNEATLHRSA
jgi:hypothetical protein